MTEHQAAEQMLGYLYQVRYALALLLDNEDDEMQISIEKFDDVAFSEDDIPKQLIQLKHHVKKTGDLSDTSTDLWKTLKVWIDAIASNSVMPENTKFLIITTASAPDNSAASYLKTAIEDDERNTEKVYELLLNVCNTSTNKAHSEYYDAFKFMSKTIIQKLLANMVVLDKASNIIDVDKNIRKIIRYSCQPKFENQVCERLEGWWYKKSIEALSSSEPVFITQNQVRTFIVSICQEYADDNLPIDIWDAEEFDDELLPPNERLFCEQLKLISVGKSRIRISLRDYYRAFRQRANWVRNDLLYLNELDRYEQRLVDEWEHCFAEMKDTLLEYEDIPDEKIIAKHGRNLFSQMEEKDVRIRPKCSDAFVMRGSYHILANQLKVGWHADFYARLKHLLA